MVAKKGRIGLSLSGGGYRAAAFHLGTLNKLYELGVLKKVDVLSTISGGSITGAAWCLHSGDYPSFHQEMIGKLQTVNIIQCVFRSWAFVRTILLALLFISGALFLSFTYYSWLVFPLLIVFFLYTVPFSVFDISREQSG